MAIFKTFLAVAIACALILIYIYINDEIKNVYYMREHLIFKHPLQKFKPDFMETVYEEIHSNIKSFDFGSKEWRNFYPEIGNLLNKIELGYIAWPKNIKETTSAVVTEVQFFNTNKMKIGDRLKGIIVAKDHNGKNKIYGGDLFRARLMHVDENDQITYDGIPCQITDHNNGTYGISAQLYWEGTARIVVELIHPSESIILLIQNSTKSEGQGVNFEGTFPSGTKTFCNIGLSLRNFKEICNFSNKHTGVSWYCYKPVGEKCASDLIWIDRIYDKNITFQLKKNEFFRKNVNWQTPILGSGLEFKIFPSPNRIVSQLPKCKLDTGMKNTVGLFESDHWVSLQCHNVHIDVAFRNIKSCLAHTTVYFIGDSTMRQWYYKLVSALHLRDTGEENSRIKQTPRIGTNNDLGVTVYYRAHGPPLFNSGPPSSRPHIVSTLDSIEGGTKNPIVVINEGLHLLLYDPQYYISRLKAVRAAILRLQNRVPDAKILIRGAIRHVSSNDQCPSEWFSFRHDRILRAIFSSVPNLGYVDTWEMTTVHPQDNVHPNDKMVEQNVALFLSYICTN